MNVRALHRLVFIAGEHRSVLSRWTGRAGFTLLDQAALSGANFAFSLFLVRTMSADDYGYFAISFTIFMIVLGFYSALVLEPLGVLGAVKDQEAVHDYLANLFWFQLGVSVILAVMVALGGLAFGGNALTGSLLMVAVVLPASLLGWAVRRACYLNADAQTAALSSASYAIALMAIAVVMERSGTLSASSAWLAIAAATLLSAVIPWIRLRVPIHRPRVFPLEPRLVGVSVAHWQYGKWLLVTAALAVASQQLPYLLAAHVDGVAAAGQLRASVLFIVPALQVMISLGVYLFMPVLARDAAQHRRAALHHKACLITAGFTLFSIGYGVVLVLGRHLVADGVLAGRTPQATRLIPVLVLWPIASALGSGFALALRASELTAFFPISSAVTAVVGVVSITTMTLQWGVLGAAISTVITVAALSVVAGVLYVRWIYRPINAPPE